MTTQIKLAATAVFAVLVVLGFLFYQVKSDDEPKLDDTAIFVEEIKEMAQLFSTSYYSEVILDTAKKSGWLSETELVIIAKGICYAGVDLSALNSSDFIFERDTLFITLGESEILETIVNPADFEIWLDEGNWSYEEVQDFKAKSIHIVEDRARANGIIERSNNRVAKLLTEFFGGLNYKNVKVNFK